MPIEDNFDVQAEKEIIQQIIEAKTTLEAVTLVRDIFEFKHATLFYLKQHTNPNLLPFINTTFADKWVERYILKQYRDIDPIFNTFGEQSEPFYWSDFEMLRDENSEFYRDVLDHGLGVDAYCIPNLTAPNRFSHMSVTSDLPSDALKEKISKLQAVLKKISNELHLKAIEEAKIN